MPTDGHLYGYLFTKGKGEGRGIRIPDTDKAPTVQNIFNWYVQEGLSLEGIQKRLYALGIPSPNGKPYWMTSTILRLLSNRGYTGKTLTQWQVGGLAETIEVPGATPALMDSATFDAAQERMRLNKPHKISDFAGAPLRGRGILPRPGPRGCCAPLEPQQAVPRSKLRGIEF